MADKEPDGDWQAEDAIAKEMDISNSSPTRKTFDDVELSDGEDNGMGEVEVLIKSGKEAKDDEKYRSQPKRKWSPRKDAFFFSKYISFFWSTNLLKKGSKKPLEQEDLEGVNPEDCLHPLTEEIERNWYREAYDEDGKIKKKASLLKVLVKTFGFQYFIIGFFPFFAEILKLVQPVFMGWVIEYFQSPSSSSETNAYVYAFLMVACFVGQSWTVVPFNYLRQMYGIQARVATTGLIYKKVMNMSHRALARSSSGFIVNLISNDSAKLEIASFFMHYLWIGPIELVVLIWLLMRELGPTALAGIAALLLLTPVQLVIGKFLFFFRRKVLVHTDARVKIMNEIISGMKVIKLYTWEESFSELIRELRWKEIKSLRKLLWLRAAIMSFFFSAGSFVSFITFMVYVLAGNQLTPQKVFTTVALFNVAKTMFTLYFPIGITLFNEGRVAVERMQKLLLEEEVDPEGVSIKTLRPKLEECGVTASNISASWTEEGAQTLKNLTFNVKAGELLAIVGPVGSGKSSVLMTLLGELPVTEGNLQVKGKVAYASQESWIFNGTLRYNITFGKEFDEQRYTEVIKACALEKDLELLANGDQTLVGERGVSLSGGQKARVNLARAVYSDADLYIMDDPLSAVDASVGRHLYNKCINGFLEDKPRILVTHQIQYLTDADTIIALTNGSCIGKGTFYELTEMGIDFMNLINKVDEDEDTGIESGDELDGMNRFERAQRRFSQQLECVEDELRPPGYQAPPTQHKPKIQFQRQVTQTSYNSFGCDMTESSITLAHDVQETVTFEEEKMDTLVPKEVKQDGNIGSDVIAEFFKSGYGKCVWISLLLLFAICQAVFILADWWLSQWSENETKSGGDYTNRNRDLGIYAALVIALVTLGLTRALLFFQVMLKSTMSIHLVMFDAIMRAPMYFFDTNSIGRILNRFSKDTSLVDDMFGFSLFDLAQSAFVVVGVFALVSMNLPLILAVVVPVIVAFFMLRYYYIKTARELKRIEGVARSPIFGHFSTTLLGLPTIRAFNVQDRFFDILAETQDAHTEAYTSFLGCAGWLSFNLDLLCGMFITFTCFMCLILQDNLEAGVVGLMLAYAIGIPATFQQFVRQTTEAENQFTSVERVLEYGHLESEGERRTDVVPEKEWPERGSIIFDQLNFTYHKTLPDVLHNVTAHVKSMEKIGVCGRTGAGKSSLLSTLFRTSEPGGLITIDGMDITKIGLKDLRTKISIIPQEPILFSGSMRKNIDPFTNYTDLELWQVLEEVQLKEAISEMPGKLETVMEESGSNLSVGQRQLVCLARAILKRNRVLVIDEATANVDPKTDALIQTTIREKFKDCTVLTIAHRLHTIMDSDRIMVLDAGNLKEFDEPYKLLRCRNSILYSLVAQTGRSEAQNLFEMAVTTHEQRLGGKRERSVTMGDCGEKCNCEKHANVSIEMLVEDPNDVDEGLVEENGTAEEANEKSEQNTVVEEDIQRQAEEITEVKQVESSDEKKDDIEVSNHETQDNILSPPSETEHIETAPLLSDDVTEPTTSTTDTTETSNE